MTWQLIGTAPKDGTEVILTGFIGGYEPRRWYSAALWVDRDIPDESGWFADTFDRWPLDKPTHWMPLPPSPEDLP